MKQKNIFISLLLFIGLLLPSYSFGYENISPTRVILSESNVYLNVGQQQKLIAIVEPTNATNRQVKWMSTNESVVTVDESGSVRALSEGTANIVVVTKEGGITDTCTVVVNDDMNTGNLSLNKNDITLLVGGKERLIARFNSKELSSEEVSWKSSNENIASVDQNGVVTGISEGSVAIAVITKEESNMQACKVDIVKNNLPKYGFDKWNGNTNCMDVEPDKEWKIKFNKEIDMNSLEKNIIILDKNTGEIFPIELSCSLDKKYVTIGHSKEYKHDGEYILYIVKYIKEFGSNKTLKTGIMMPFSVCE